MDKYVRFVLIKKKTRKKSKFYEIHIVILNNGFSTYAKP